MADSDSTPLECTLDAAARLEAVLMTTDRPISDRRLTEAAGLDAGDSVGELVSSLNEIYESSGRVFRVVRVASGWQVMTIPDADEVDGFEVIDAYRISEDDSSSTGSRSKVVRKSNGSTDKKSRRNHVRR